MAVYSDTYDLADLEKEFPSANYSTLRRILSERRAKKAVERRKKLDEEYDTLLERCPTTGRTLKEEIKAHGK